MDLVFVIGCTNAGKTTLLDSVRLMYPQEAALVEVGKLMRAKYPPSHFAGQSNPKHTQEEAWQMMVAGIDKAAEEGRSVVVIDGQPRDVKQTQDVLKDYVNAYRTTFLHLFAPAEVRKERAIARDGKDPEKLKLSLARLDGDIPSVYHVLSLLLDAQALVIGYDTSNPKYCAGSVLQEIGVI